MVSISEFGSNPPFSFSSLILSSSVISVAKISSHSKSEIQNPPKSRLPLRLCGFARENLHSPAPLTNDDPATNPIIQMKSDLAQRRKAAKFFKNYKNPDFQSQPLSNIQMKTILSTFSSLLASLAIAGAANEVVVQADTAFYVKPGTAVSLPGGATVKGTFYNPAGVTLGTGAWLATVDAGRLVQQAVAGDAVVVLAVGASAANPLTVTNRSGTADTFGVKVADSVADKPAWMQAVNRTWTLDKVAANAAAKWGRVATGRKYSSSAR